MQPASVSSRFAAMNLDYLILGVLSQACCIGLEKILPELATTANMILLSLVISIFYFVVPTKTSGQTLGKKLLSLKVIPENDYLGKLSWGQAFMREGPGKWISTIPLFLGFIFAFFNANRKAWHDSLSKTQVISLVIEEEKSSAQKLQQVLLGIISVPAGVGLILVAFLYTSLPLDSVKEKIEASGIQVGTLTGSLGGGLRFTDISRQDESANFKLGLIEVKFNVWSLVAEKTFYIEKVIAEEGHVEVPEDFSLSVILTNIVSILQNANAADVKIRDFTLSKIHFKNIYFEHKKKVLSHMQELLVKGVGLVENELYITEMQFQVVGFMFKANDIRSSFGRIEVGKLTGGVTPEYLPILKAPVDFHVKGVFGKNPKSIKVDAGLVIDKVKINYENEKLTASVDKMILNEVFRTSLPTEELDLKLTAQGSQIMNLITSHQVDYAMKICGNEFLPIGDKGPSFERGGAQYQFSMMPLPVIDFAQVVFAPEASLDDLFSYNLKGNKMTPPDFASAQEMLSELCYQKPYAQLKPEEIERLKPLEQVVKTGRGTGKPVVIATPTPVPSPTPTSESSLTPAPSASPEVSPTPEASPAVMPPGAPAAVAPTAVAAASPTPVAVATPIVTPTVTPAMTPAVLPTATPVVSPVASASPGAVTTPAAASPVTKSPQEKMRGAFTEAKVLLKQGKVKEALKILEEVQVVFEGMSSGELGAFYNLKGWLNIYTGNSQTAVTAFEQAFSARGELADAEGLHRSYEALKNEKEAKRWLEHIQSVLKSKPENINQLTPNMQKKINEASVGSNPQK